MLADFVDGDDVRMIQRGGGFRFGAEAMDLGSRGKPAGADHFQRHGAMEAELPREIHDAHAALGDLPQHFVVGEPTDFLRRGHSIKGKL